MVFELGHLTLPALPAPRADQWYPSLCCNEMMLRLRLLHLMLGTISTANWMDDPESPGLSCGLGGKESACIAEDLGLIPGLVRSPGEEKGCLLQYSGLENFKSLNDNEKPERLVTVRSQNVFCYTTGNPRQTQTILNIKDKLVGSRNSSYS